jgi:NADH:ubiquinone oxidoreductase subunit F (NADH-binding)
VAAVMAWLAAQSARQCGPCANGLPALAGLVNEVADGRAPRDHGARLGRWSAQVAGRGACRLPDGAVAFLRSSLRVFAEEFAEHATRGPCHACRRPLTLQVPRRGRWAA